MTNPSDPASWMLEQHEGAAADIRQEDGCLRVDVKRSGSERWHVQLFQPGKGLAPGKTYVLRFQVKASTPRKTTIITVQGANEPWQVLGGMAEVDIATSWKQYALKFTVNSDASGPMRAPLFQLGDTQGAVWLRNLTLTEAK